MYRQTFFLVAVILCCVQCLPFDLSTHTESSVSNQLHLIVGNSSNSHNYHLTPLWNAMENIDHEIENQLESVLPYLNFFFGSLLDPPNNEEEDCVNNMVIQLVPAKPTEKNVDNSTPQDNSESTEDSPSSDASVVVTKVITQSTPKIEQLSTMAPHVDKEPLSSPKPEQTINNKVKSDEKSENKTEVKSVVKTVTTKTVVDKPVSSSVPSS